MAYIPQDEFRVFFQWDCSRTIHICQVNVFEISTHSTLSPTCSWENNGRIGPLSDSHLQLIGLLEVTQLKQNTEKWKVLTSHPKHNGILKPLLDPVAPHWTTKKTCIWTQWYWVSGKQELLLFPWQLGWTPMLDTSYSMLTGRAAGFL